MEFQQEVEHDGPESGIRFFLKVFFLEENQELGSPKSDIFYQESKITKRNLILSFFSFKWIPYWKSISKFHRKNVFFFLNFETTSNKKNKGGFFKR